MHKSSTLILWRWGRRTVMSFQLAGVLDRAKVSDLAVTAILFRYPEPSVIVHKSLHKTGLPIQRQQQKLRKLSATSIQENFIVHHPLAVR